MNALDATTLGRTAARGDLSASLTAIVADDTVNMVEWWAARGVSTPISGDDLARVKLARAFADNPGLKVMYKMRANNAWALEASKAARA